MEAYHYAVVNVLRIYIEKANSLSDKAQKLVCIEGIFDYLSTADVKPLLERPAFTLFRNVMLNKMQDFANDPYVLARRQQYHRLYAVFCEMFTYLVQDDSVPLRRSERQKQRAVRKFNKCFQSCENPACQCSAAEFAELVQWSSVHPNAKPVSIKVKVLPRRSARLMNKLY